MFTNGDPILLRNRILVLLVTIVFGTSLVEIMLEFADGESLESMADDLVKFGLSTAILGAWLIDHQARRKSTEKLRQELQQARGQLAQIDQDTRNLANQYRGVMQKQFEAWTLTPSEQDVVIGILKGLSFREIALLRDTREKTVRQQASSVYRKAGLSGRHELTAWFFEDMLDPPDLKTKPSDQVL